MSSSYTKSVSSISFPTGEYDDRFVTLNQYKSVLEQGFHVNNIDALSGARDTKINNYTSFNITDKAKLSKFLSLSSIAVDQTTSLVSKLSFRQVNNAPDQFIYIFKSNGEAESNQQKPVGIRALDELGSFANNYFFELEALNNNLLRIKHNNGVFDYYLNYATGTSANGDPYSRFVFYKGQDNYRSITQERNDVFRYALDNEGYLQLYKTVGGVLNVVSLSAGQLVAVPMEAGSLNRGITNLIHIDYYLDQNKEFVNSSFISYNVKDSSNLTINPLRGSFDDVGQYIFTSNYNTISSDKMPMNYFSLDTNRSEFNFIKRGSNMLDAPYGLPGYDNREYNNLYLGNDQEGGLTNPILNYTFYNKDVFIVNGTDTYFQAPSSIYPYNRLNVNDTKFVENGSFAGPTPNLSDKLYIKRLNSTQYDNGRYLCTWLSGGVLGDTGIWVDRYYYPDKITKTGALSSDARYAPALIDSVDSLDLAVTDAVLVREKFFDKKSDAAIEPNINIKYQRVGKADITEIVDASAPLLSAYDSFFTSKTVRGETENICNDFSGKEFTFNGSQYVKFNVQKAIDTAKSFTLNFDMYLDPAINYGLELLGNNTNRGFGIFQDQTVTPFIHVVSENILYIYNTDFTLLNKIDFKTRIKQVFKRSALDDYIVATAGNLYYKVNTQGNKIKLECGSDILDYFGTHMEHDHIDFIQSNQQVQRMNVNTMSVSALSSTEFEVYKGEMCLYDNVIRYKDTLFKLPGTKTRWENANTIFYKVSNYIVKHNIDLGPETFLTSNNDIVDFNILGDQIAVLTTDRYYVYNTSGVASYTANISSINIPSPPEATTVSLTGGSFISIDWVNEYIKGDQFTYPVCLAKDSANNLYLAKGTFPTLTAAALSGVSVADNTKKSNLTNYNDLNRIYDKTSIDFKLSLTNYLNTEDILNQTISFQPSSFEPGFYNFTYRLDTLQGNSTLYINGDLYDNQTFQPGKYQIQDIFSDEFFIGSTGFQSNLDLATYLKQPNYYYSKDLTVRNPLIYDRAISTEEIYAIYLSSKDVDDITLSLPGGQRTSKTEIQQFFKFNRHNSSNLIDVVVRDLNITNTEVRDQIKTSILAEAKQFLPVGTKINNITFIDHGNS